MIGRRYPYEQFPIRANNPTIILVEFNQVLIVLPNT